MWTMWLPAIITVIAFSTVSLFSISDFSHTTLVYKSFNLQAYCTLIARRD